MRTALAVAVTLLTALALVLPVAVGLSGGAALATEGDPHIWTDKDNYGPEETVTIFGSGFLPSAEVTIAIEAPDSSRDAIYALTDELGAFATQYQLNGIEGTYTVTATDGTNTATTTFTEKIKVTADWKDSDCANIEAHASGLLDAGKSYCVTYADPVGVVQGTSSTYSGPGQFKDYFVVDITLPNMMGTWTVKLYETPATLRDTDTVSIDKMVWTTDSTYAAMKTSFAQGETVYFKTIGLLTGKYYKFMLEDPAAAKIYVGDWTTGVTTLTGSYPLPSDAPTGSWKVHVGEADNAEGKEEGHYVDRYFTVTPCTAQYYLTVISDGCCPINVAYDDFSANVTAGGNHTFEDIPCCTNVTLTADDSDVYCDFVNWMGDVPGSSSTDNPITIHIDDDKSVTGHCEPVTPPAAICSIGYTLFYDNNGNGVHDPGEPGIAGATVNLYKDDGNGVFNPTGGTDDLIGTRTTGGDGVYLFPDLDPWCDEGYWVLVLENTLPPGVTLTTGSNPIGPICLEEGGFYDLADFGYQPPVPVGGEAYPVNKLGILVPWITLAALLVGSTSWFAPRRREARS